MDYRDCDWLRELISRSALKSPEFSHWQREQPRQDNSADFGSAEVAVLCLDLDGFQELSAAVGQTGADALLRQVSHRLTGNIRASDRVMRLGGGAFAVVQRGRQLASRTAQLAQRLIVRLAAPYEVEGRSVAIGVSIGIAHGASDTAAPDRMLREAEAALAQAKADGGGCYRLYHPIPGADAPGG